jgi:cbb3-type cytochrome oxidase subunit 3
MLQSIPANTRSQLAGLWTALMLLYIYADIFSFYRPGYLAEVAAGKMGPLDVSQGTLLMAAALMTLPALMIWASLALPATLARWSSIVLGGLYLLVNISNLVGESWAYYLAMGAVEILVTFAITVTAWRWPKQV